MGTVPSIGRVHAMSKHRPHPPPSERQPPDPPRGPSGRRPRPLPVALRLVLSLLFIWHVAAVFMAPLSIGVMMSQSMSIADPRRRETPLAIELAQQKMQWYLDALYLNHGYHFFAPDPGPGHLIRYAIHDEQGQQIEAGRFPDRDEHWPRLFYHRFLMLADQSDPPLPLEEGQTPWKERYLRAYGRELLRQRGGASVRLERIIHHPLYRDDALDGQPLTLEATYEVDTEIVVRRDDLDLPAPESTGPTTAPTSRRDPVRRDPVRRDVSRRWQGGWQ